MYLNLLDDDEKRAFAELAEKMIEADGLVIGREASALAALNAEMGVTETGGGGRTVDELAGVFKSRRSKIAALLELIGLGYSDTAFSVSEESLVNSVANQMAVSPDDLHRALHPELLAAGIGRLEDPVGYDGEDIPRCHREAAGFVDLHLLEQPQGRRIGLQNLELVRFGGVAQ